MSYNPSIPQSTDNLSTSQAQMLTNFFQLNQQFGVDHVPFNTGTGNGDGTHVQITFDSSPASPSPTGTISNIFPQTVGGIQELFFANASSEYNGTGKVQLTGPSTIGPNGSALLPGGFILKWGSSNFSGTSTAVTVPFPVAFPSSCYSVSVIAITSINQAANTVSASGFNNLHIVVNRAGGAGVIANMSINYIAIGK